MGKDNFGKIIHSSHFVANVLLKPMNVYFVMAKNTAHSFICWMILKKKKKTEGIKGSVILFTTGQ